jgi:hypothetical protein
VHWGGKTALNRVSFYKFTNILVMMDMETNMDTDGNRDRGRDIRGVNTNKCESPYNSLHFDF